MKRLQEVISESSREVDEYGWVSKYIAMNPQEIDFGNAHWSYIMWNANNGIVTVFNIDNLNKFCNDYCEDPEEAEEMMRTLKVRVNNVVSLDGVQFWMRIK